MSFPNNQTLDATLLVFISLCGGWIDKKQIPTPLAVHFGLTNADLCEKTKDGRQKWANLCEFSRERGAEEEYVHRPDDIWEGIKVRPGTWALTSLGKKEAERLQNRFGEAAFSQLAALAAPIKRENDDPFFDLL